MKFCAGKDTNDLPRHMQGRLIEVIKKACQRQGSGSALLVLIAGTNTQRRGVMHDSVQHVDPCPV